MGEGARGRWLDSDGRWQPGPPPDGWWQERGGGDRWYPPALANHPAARRPPGMPRPWARDGDRERDVADDHPDRDGRAGRDATGDRADGSDPPSAEGTGEAFDDALDLVDELLDDPAAFPTLDPPWPDGDLPDRRWPDVGGALREPLPESDGVHIVWPPLDEGGDEEDGDDALPLLRLGPSWNEPAPCRVPRRQLRPVHRRRSRHSFEPADLSDIELDQLLRGPSLSTGSRSDDGSPAGAGRWPVWAKIAVMLVVVLAGLGVLGVLDATAGGSADTITTREPRRGPNPTADDPPPVVPSPRAPSVPAPGASQSTTTAGPAPAQPDWSAREVVPPGDAPPPATTAVPNGPPAAVPPASPASQAAPASPAAPPANPKASPPSCHPSYDPCVPVADDVDCAGGQGNGPAFVEGPIGVVGADPYGLDADHDGLGCE